MKVCLVSVWNNNNNNSNGNTTTAVTTITTTTTMTSDTTATKNNHLTCIFNPQDLIYTTEGNAVRKMKNDNFMLMKWNDVMKLDLYVALSLWLNSMQQA